MYPKVDGTAIVNGKDLDLVMPMYNLLEYSSNYSDTTGSLWFYSQDELNFFNNHIVNNDDFKYFKYNSNGANRILRNRIIDIRLKYLSNFWRSLEMSVTNWKIELKLKWENHYDLSVAGADNDDAKSNNIFFTIKNTKLCFYCHFISKRHQETIKRL